MLAVLKSRWFLALIGLILLGLVIWFGGPYVAIADHKPLEDVVGRLIGILVLVAVYALIVTIGQLRSKQSSQKLAAGIANQAEAGGSRAAARGAGDGDSQALRKRFEEATEALKKSRRGGAASLYELPWYIIIGPPGAGKTTILVNSGLNFPLAKSFGREALRGVGGTRNCDWWFTDEAILLDTAGRYTTQDSSSQADAAGWTSFLQLLRKYRRRQPINGVIMAISAVDLLTLADKDRELHVTAIRERLAELVQELKINPPVYVLITKCDLIAGFSEFFDDMGQEGRAQVWGTTFPIDATESGAAAEGFESEFDVLLQRVQARVVTRLEQERDVRRRAAILSFPQQLAGLEPTLVDFLRRAFGASSFDAKVMLRGVYLTSGTQDGTPIDRMLGAIARSFGFSSAVKPAAAGMGKAYFIERLLRNVIFRESGLAGVNRRLQWQKRLVHGAAYIGCVVALCAGVLLLYVSYRSNSKYIADVAQATDSLTHTAVALGTGLSVAAVLPRLDALRAVAQAANQSAVPLDMRMGLYQGRAIGGAAHAAYLREVNALLLPALGAGFEHSIAANASEPDRLYEYLKGYLMLGDASHRDVEHLRFVTQVIWPQLVPSDTDARQQLSDHFEQLLRDPGHFESLTLNQDVVAQARAALRIARLPVLMYSRLKLNYRGDDKRAVHLERLLGPTADIVLTRKSGAKLSEPMPALYTRPVFNEVNSKGKYEIIKQFADDAWVFGEGVFDLKQTAALPYQVMQVYEQDYIAKWDAVVADVRLRSAIGQQPLIAQLTYLGAADSPLKGFLAVVADNTNLLKPDDSALNKATNAAADAIAARAAALAKTFGEDSQSADQDKPGAKTTAHFESIQRLVDGPPGGAEIDRVLAAITQINAVLKAAGGGVGKSGGADPKILKDANDAKDSADLESKQLPPGIDAMVSDVGAQALDIVKGQASGELGRMYSESVAKECHNRVEGQYPFSGSSAPDVSLDDFAVIFADNGTFDKFFRENLASLVDTSRSPWAWKEGAPTGGRNLLPQFQTVKHIRDVYFQGGAKPTVSFLITPESLDTTVSKLVFEVDGQTFDYQFGAASPHRIVWPGPGAAGHAVVSFEVGGASTRLEAQGPWALFRLLEQARIQRQDDKHFAVTFSKGGYSVRFLIEANSVFNPFARNELQSFRCGA
jgi:type VI secretion system protein ImpL